MARVQEESFVLAVAVPRQRKLFAWTGVTQRVVRHEFKNPPHGKDSAGRSNENVYAHGILPCFQPLPESQPVLPCLLRRLLQVLNPRHLPLIRF